MLVKRKYMTLGLVGYLFMLLAFSAAWAESPVQGSQPAVNKPQEKLSERAAGLRAYARLQALIEYYFMENGFYPASLEALEAGLNMRVFSAETKKTVSLLPKDAPMVTLGNDPVTGKPFVYTVSSDGRSYTLSLPEPKKYGNDVPELCQVDWGWLAVAAEGKRVRRITANCAHNLEELAALCEFYAKDHKKAFPPNFEALRPQYMPEKVRFPRCPACNLEYVYEFRRGGYTIACPDPHKHGLAGLKYDSEKGLMYAEFPNAQAQPKAKEQPNAQAQPKAKEQLDAQTQPKAKEQPDAQTQPKAKEQPDAQAQPRTKE